MKIFFIIYLIFSFKSFGGMLTQEELDLIGGSNIQYKPGVCDPKTIVIDNLEHNYVTKVPVNEQLYLSCKRPYGYRTKDKGGKTIIESSFYVMCQKDGSFKGLQKCEETCDASSVLKSSSNYDLPKTKNLTTGGSVSGSKLVMHGDELEIFCFEGYIVKDLSNEDTAVRSFKYTCGASDPAKRRILECIKQPAKFDSIPPKSDYKSGDKIPKNCRVSSIATLNASITGGTAVTGGTVPEVIKPGQTLDYTCDKGLFTTTAGFTGNSDLGYKISKKFTATCDPEGGGNFIGVKGCSPRCNASELQLKSSEKNLETVQKIEIVKKTGNPINEPIGTIQQKNEVNSSTDPLFVDINSRVKVTCKPGYQIRKTFKDHYYANCLAGGEFDIGQEAQICETEVKPCNNSEIDTGGALLTYNSTTVGPGSKDVTQVGSTLNVACKGGPQYNDNGTKPTPRCVYDPVTKSGKWENNHTTFFCYDGCIFSDSLNQERKVSTKDTTAVYSDKLLYIITDRTNGSTKVGAGLSPTTVNPGLRIRNTDFGQFYSQSDSTKMKTISYNIQNGYAKATGVSEDNTITILHGNGVFYRIGIFFERNTTLYHCATRQEMPKTFNFDYQLLRASNFFLENTSSGDRTTLAFFQPNMQCNANNGTECMEGIKKDYDVKNGQSYYVKDLSLRINMNNINNGNEKTECNNIITAVIQKRIPELKRDVCSGGLVSNACHKDFTFNPALIEAMRCVLHDGLSGKMERTRYRSFATTLGSPNYESSKGQGENPALTKFEF